MNIRFAKPEDASELLKIYTPYVLETAISFEYQAPSLEEFTFRISNILKKFPYLVYEENGQILAYSYASTFHERKAYDISAELSIYVKQGFHKNGIGKALYKELEKELLKRNIHTLYACIAATSRENDEHLTDGSIKFHQKCGFKQVGYFTDCAIKFNKSYDMTYMEKHI